jgi:hypothetical protein
MKQVFSYIGDKAHEFAKEPLFHYLRDERIDAAEKLQFVPWAAHFVMTFADLCAFFLPSATPRDRYEELANIHLSEEVMHRRWYLADLAKIGMDPNIRFTDALRFLWGDATVKTRMVTYELCKLSAGLNSLQKLVMVCAIEATGRVALEALTPAGVEVETRSGRRLVYFGGHHLETELKHTIEGDAVRSSLEAVALDEVTRGNLFSIVETVFDCLRGFAEESFGIAKGGCSLEETLKQLQMVG